MSRYKTKEAVHNRAKDAIGTPLELIYEQCGQYDANPQSKNYVGDAFEAWMDVPKTHVLKPICPKQGLSSRQLHIKF